MAMQKTIKLTVNTTKDLWPYKVVGIIQRVMEQGEADGKSGWENILVKEHAERAYNHVLEFIEPNVFTPYGHDGEDHLAHAFTRLMMALAIREGYVRKEVDNA